MAPSNPIVSIGPIVAVPGMKEALRAAHAPVVGVSPIIGGAAVRGMADQLLDGLGIENSAAGVARHLGSRSDGGLLDGWLVDTEDAGEVEGIEAAQHRGAKRPPLHARHRHHASAGGRRARPGHHAGRPFMTLTLDAVDGIGEIEPGDDLAALVVEHATLADDDVVVITSKVVSKAAGLAADDKERLIDEQTDRAVATRGGTRIIRTRHGTHAGRGRHRRVERRARHVPAAPS